MTPGTDRKFAETMDHPWLRNQVETHLLWGNYKHKNYYLLFIAAYFITVNLIILNTVNISGLFSLMDWRGNALVVAMLMGIIFGNYYTNAIFWGITKFMFLMLCPMFIVLGVVNLLRNEPGNMEIIISGIALFPSLEFIPKFSKHQKIITLGRIIILLPTCSYLAKIG